MPERPSNRTGACSVRRLSSAAGAGSVLFIPGSAHVSGASGTNWRTDVEVANPGASQASFTIALLKRQQDNSSPSSKTFTLDGGKSVRYEDALATLFGFSGAAALRITVDAGMIAVTSRTYNATSSGTYGQFIDAALQVTGIGTNQEGRLIQLTHNRSSSSGYRTNIGFVNATGAPLKLTVELYRASGSLAGTKSYNLAPFEYRQIDKIYQGVTSSDVDDGYAVLYTTTSGGRFFAYASVVDNTTGDPVYITPAVRAHQSGAPPVTPTPTPTPPASSLNLAPYTPNGWEGPLVVSGTQGGHTSGGVIGGWSTYIDWCFANIGTVAATFPAGKHIVSLLVDGQTLVNFYSDQEFTLEGNHYYAYDDWETTAIDQGHHTVQMVVDPEHVIAETDENDNTASHADDWVLASPGPPARSLRVINVPISKLRKEPLPAARGSAGTMSASATQPAHAIYIPASAHVSGAQGTNWRTDLELHNPGSGQGRYEVALLKRDRGNPSPSKKTFTVQAGHSLRLTDVLGSQFGLSGAAALRITPLQGEVIVTSRTYNLTSHGTYGQFIGGVDERTALATGERALQIQLSHRPGTGAGFRTNLGMLNCSGVPMTVHVELFSSSGSKYGTKDYSLEPYEFVQKDKIFEKVTSSTVNDGFIRLSTTTAGARFLAYASIIDNRTGDPVFAPAIPVLASPPSPASIDAVADAVFGALGRIGTGTKPSIVETVTSILQTGVDALLDQAVAANPGTVSRIPNGIEANFGNHFVASDGSVLSGRMRWVYRNLNRTSDHVSLDFTASEDNLVWNGQYAEFGTVTGSAEAKLSSGVVTGDI
ncbi:MAG TPA: hypothetical protein ENK19_05490, partial [Acidobacteria bacterium]|nr:hypothetical protein [Acidobacteriota bacterium]